MAIDQWLVKKAAQLFYARYGKTLRTELHKWNRMLEEGRLIKIIEQLGSYGHDITLRPGVEILAPEKVHLGSHVAIGYNSLLRGQGGITIEDYVLVGDNVLLTTVGHPLGELYFSNVWHKPIVLKQNVWLAANVIVLPGVTIGENSAVGAGAVVTEDIPPNSLAVGMPARVLRELEIDFDLLEKQKRRWREERVNHPTFPPLVYED